jgi:hypothetical protein
VYLKESQRMKTKISVGVMISALLGGSIFVNQIIVSAQTVPVSSGIIGSTWSLCVPHGNWCSFSGTKTVRYGAGSTYAQGTYTGGVDCNDYTFVDPAPGIAKHCDIEVPTYQPVVKEMALTDADWKNILVSDLGGNHGAYPTDPYGPVVGTPCNAPTSWPNLKLPETGFSAGTRNRSSISVWTELYNACDSAGGRPQLWNSKVQMSPMSTWIYFYSRGSWVEFPTDKIWGAAYAEDFENNESVTGDIEDARRPNFFEVQSGLWNARGKAGTANSRSPYSGYNFHGYGSRHDINWRDVKAVMTVQAMRCVPVGALSLDQCNSNRYIANVGIDAWQSATAVWDNFVSHDGVGFGRFKPVTTSWQLFTTYVGPADFAEVGVPPLPNL